MICVRCGISEPSIRMRKRHEKKVALLCRSCISRPAKTVNTDFGRCIPWHGDFTLEDEPINPDGSKYLPGERLCGMRDCVNKAHLK